MVALWKLTILIATLAAAIAPAFSQSVGVDPALMARANAGDTAAQVLVAERYAANAAHLRNTTEAGEAYKLAAEWYRRAAEEGLVEAQLRLAALYRDGGKGFPRDMAQAATWYRKAAEEGDVGAQATLAVLYSMGQGVPRNDVEAYYWFDLAASVKGPNQEKYAANRQKIGTHITADELEDIKERVEKWLAAHPRQDAAP
jgi:hypothetical protein